MPHDITMEFDRPKNDHAHDKPSLDNPDTSHDNIVLKWNNAALQAIRDTHPGPPIVARALAILHTCMLRR